MRGVKATPSLLELAAEGQRQQAANERRKAQESKALNAKASFAPDHDHSYNHTVRRQQEARTKGNARSLLSRDVSQLLTPRVCVLFGFFCLFFSFRTRSARVVAPVHARCIVLRRENTRTAPSRASHTTQRYICFVNARFYLFYFILVC